MTDEETKNPDTAEPRDPSATATASSAEDAGSPGGDDGGGPEGYDARLVELTAERDKFRDQLLRTAADFDNYRKRARKDVEDAKARSRDEILREVLEVIDNLERADKAAATATDIQAVANGVRLVLQSFESVAQRLGLERVSSLGERFDPNLHDAVQQVESAEHEPGTVLTEIVAGYRLDGRLVRPSLVVVSKAVTN